MRLNFDAIFRNGVLHPLVPVEIADQSRVRVRVEIVGTPLGPLGGNLGKLSADAANELRRIVREEFESLPGGGVTEPRD